MLLAIDDLVFGEYAARPEASTRKSNSVVWVRSSPSTVHSTAVGRSSSKRTLVTVACSITCAPCSAALRSSNSSKTSRCTCQDQASASTSLDQSSSQSSFCHWKWPPR